MRQVAAVILAAGEAKRFRRSVGALPSTARGAVILLGDMPRIAPSLIDRLIDAFDAAPVEPVAVVPVRGGRRGNPALIGRGLFAAVGMLEGDKGARDLIAATRENILELPVGDSAIEIDIDTREDLRRCHVTE